MHQPDLDFTHVLMSSIHDIKNSLLLFQSTLDYLDEQRDCTDPDARGAMSRLQYETQRINNSLIQVLSLYKLEQSMVHLQAQHHSVYLFLKEQVLSNRPIAEYLGVELVLDCAEDLEWQFDKRLMEGVVGTILNNAVRYSRRRIEVTAGVEDDCLAIHILDDGDGYPDTMLEDAQDTPGTEINFASGSTGLGLFFASRIVAMHEYQGLHGHTRLRNRTDGGGHFSAYIPGPRLSDLGALLGGV